MTDLMTPLSDEVKKDIIETQPDGIWIVLAEELPRDTERPSDILPLERQLLSSE